MSCEGCECSSDCGGKERRAVLRSLATGREFDLTQFAPLVCYLAGKMAGVWRFNEAGFTKGAATLRNHGVTVVSPFEVDIENGYLVEGAGGDLVQGTNFDYEAVLADDFKVVEHVDFVTLLPGWQTSPGANREVQHAASVGVPTYEMLWI